MSPFCYKWLVYKISDDLLLIFVMNLVRRLFFPDIIAKDGRISYNNLLKTARM